MSLPISTHPCVVSRTLTRAGLVVSTIDLQPTLGEWDPLRYETAILDPAADGDISVVSKYETFASAWDGHQALVETLGGEQ